MRETIRRCSPILAAATLLAACAVTTGGPARGDTRADQDRVTMTLITGEGFPQEAEEFANAVAQVSGGSIEVTVQRTEMSGTPPPTYETDVIQAVAAGTVKLGYVGARAFDAVDVEAFDALHAPFVVDSYALEAAVLHAADVQALLDSTRSVGVVGLGYVQGSLRRPLGYSRPLMDLADYSGARIGVHANPIMEQTMQALGAVPVEFAPGAAAGLDGMEVHVPQIDLGKYDNGANSLTGNVVFWPRVGVIFANAGVFDALTSAQQAMLRDAARVNLEASIAGMAESERNSLIGPCRRGLTVVMAPDGAVSRLRAAAQPVVDRIRSDDASRRVLETIEELKASTNAPVDVVACPAPRTTPVPSRAEIDSPIVGTWVTSFTKEEFQGSPLVLDAGERNDPSNWGDLTFTFKPDGGFRSAVRNATTYGFGTGTYTVTGDRVVIDMYDNGVRGDTFVGRWSIFGDTLTFERVPDGVLPTPWLIKSWTRSP